ncbi:IS66 Orf2 family protein [Nitritalea halalkaliphila LW7]|uniref:IS66 Orf2 family protein n=2 Tax=Nitritalea halalkaliphila LW7 TaxID=1189621 RepID=I5BTZ0_9BACT|nr:IS66 family insertion sequence element accessory protein TnpB [Nitritalea halalkaliphila]EIM73042.1 IS66 Orf2 family protein [Nitritalea halalkaliphila LW7]
MLALSSATRYFLYEQPTDMRYGIQALAGIVRNKLGFDPMSGDVFIFIGKRGDQIRLLQWDQDGFALYIKRLERGTFERPRSPKSLLSSRELGLLLQGVRLESVRYRKRYMAAGRQ